MVQESSLKKFTENFFISLKAEISWEYDFLKVSNIPEKFEKFFGKKGPYKIGFSQLDNKENVEIVSNGSYLLKCMSEYLENKGKTTLLKINFEGNSEKEAKQRFNLMNSDISKIIKKIKNNFFVRFTFQTNIRFMNKVEKRINHLFAHDGEIVSGDLEDYNVIEGNKKDIDVSEIKQDYEIAKKEISNLVSKDIDKISELLAKNLDKEIKRIEQHFKQQVNEAMQNIANLENKVFLLKEENKPDNLSKINKLESSLIKLKDSVDLSNIEREKQMEIKNETLKHSLNLENKLINTTIIYYPISVFSINIKNSSSARIFELSHNPLTDSWNDLFCESCKEKIEDIFLCSSGHISCNNCINSCPSCNNHFCTSCLVKECSICGKKFCKDCMIKCSLCGKQVCNNHARKDKISGKVYCTNCLKLCPKCSEYRNPRHFKKSIKSNREICEFCSVKEVNEKIRHELNC